MAHTSARRYRAVWDRPATGTRLLPSPHSLNPHYKRCPKAERLSPRSDQPLSRPVPVTGYGMFPDKNWLALSNGSCQVRAPLSRRTILALSGDAHEHGVKPLPRAIVPRDSTVVAFGELIPLSDGSESTLTFLRVVGHFWWSRLPHTARFPRVSSTSSQKHGAVAKSASMWSIRCGGQHASVQASPSSCATVRDIPSPTPPPP